MKPFILAATVAAAATLVSSAARAESGRISFFGTFQNASFADGTTRAFSDLTAGVTVRSDLADDRDGVEYAVDVRQTAYPSSDGRSSRTRLYDAWTGGRMANGHLSVRAGQMWLQDFGSLGSIGGLMAEYRTGTTAAGRLRLGLFAGSEPKRLEAGYVPNVRKHGAWIALDGKGLRRHVLGFVTTRNSGLTERSVVTAANFLPMGKKVFVYQLAEYDLDGPEGSSRGLNYVFANARITPSPSFEVMGTVHRGRSIDARTITDDILNGRPVDQKALDGFLFESAGGRVTVVLPKNVHVYGGYTRDRHNREETSYGRISAGIWAGNIAGSGFDVTLSDNRSQRPGGSQDSWYASLGRGFGRRVYATVDYATALSVIRVVEGGAVIEHRPRSKRYGASGLWNVNRAWSVTLALEQLLDETSTDDRMTFGLVWRFQEHEISARPESDHGRWPSQRRAVACPHGKRSAEVLPRRYS